MTELNIKAEGLFYLLPEKQALAILPMISRPVKAGRYVINNVVIKSVIHPKTRQGR